MVDDGRGDAVDLELAEVGDEVFEVCLHVVPGAFGPVEFVPFHEFGDDVDDFGVDVVGQAGRRGAAEFEFPRPGIGLATDKGGAFALAFTPLRVVVDDPFAGLFWMWSYGHFEFRILDFLRVSLPFFGCIPILPR